MSPDQILAQSPIKDSGPEPLRKGDNCAGRDSKLQASRRIDWRFLLPNAQLGRVAYLGPNGGTLPAALQQFSDSLTVISVPYPVGYARNKHSNFELVVLRSENLADIESAITLLQPGGYLYLEIDRTKWSRYWRETMRRDRVDSMQNSIWQEHLHLRHFHDYVVSLDQLGLCNVQINWHRPSFESCLEIIPLDDPLALGYVFSRPSGNFAGQIKLAIGRYLMKIGLLARLVPCLSIIAYKRLASTEKTV